MSTAFFTCNPQSLLATIQPRSILGCPPTLPGIKLVKLTDKACSNAEPASRQYKLTDSMGLCFLVKSNGSKLWQMRYTFLGKEKTASISQSLCMCKDSML